MHKFFPASYDCKITIHFRLGSYLRSSPATTVLCPLWISDVKCLFFNSQDLVLYYFSAHWCPPCRQFTPMLKDFYEVTRLLMKIKIKHVFVRKLRESRLSLFLLIARLRT